MSPVPATALLERRGRIRNMARAGMDPRAIAAELRFGTRTVLSVLAMPETDLERDAADLLAGWSPDCMDATDWTHWQRMNPRNVPGGKALKPCWDCPVEFAVEMRAEDRCNGSPGRPTGRPVRDTALIALPEFTPIPVPVDVRPIDLARASYPRLDDQVALMERARAHSPVDRMLAVKPAPPEEEPAMPDDPETTTPDVDEPAPRVELEQALEALASRATAAAGAWSDKVAAEQAWEEARAALEDAWLLVGRGREEEALSQLVDVAAQAIDAGLEEAAEPVSDPGADHAETIPVAATAAQRSHGLTLHEQRVLASTMALKGDRRAVAKELGLTAAINVELALERIGKKGLLPAELIPLLPARFAKYARVAGR